MKPTRMSLHDKQILLIDQNAGNLVVLKRALSGANAQHFTTAKSASEAIRLCKQTHFDIVICELQLEAGPNGTQLIEMIRVAGLVDVNAICVLISADLQRPPLLGKAEVQPDDYVLKPFSPPTLVTRLTKAYEKRTHLRALYQAMIDGDLKKAVNACHDEINKAGRYRQFCSLIMVELMWRQGEYKQAFRFLSPIINDQQLPWAVIAMAKTQLYLHQFTEATESAKQLLDNRMVAPDAHEVLAQCLLRADQLTQACEEVKKAVDLAPHSIERQYLGCEIAQASGDYEFAKQCCLQIMEQARHSIHRNIAHLCNYVRAIVDQAQHAQGDDAKSLQQEALDTLQKEQHSALVKQASDFNFNAFSQLITGRIEALQGQLVAARDALAKAKQHAGGDQLDTNLVTDAAVLMQELGAYDQLATLLKTTDLSQLDSIAAKRINQIESQCSDTLKQLAQLLETAQEEESNGRFRAAYDALKKANEISANSPDILIALCRNIFKIQSALAKPDPQISHACKQFANQIEKATKTDSQQQQWLSLRADLAAYLN